MEKAVSWITTGDRWFWFVCAIGIIWWVVTGTVREIRIERDLAEWRKQRER